MFRIRGGSWVTTRPSITMSPAVGSSIPAIIRRSVVFPHPDGPRRTRNSPSSVARSTCATALTCPNNFDIARISTRPMMSAASKWYALLRSPAQESDGARRQRTAPPRRPQDERRGLLLPAHEPLLPPLHVDRLDQEFGLRHRLFGLHPPGGVGHHVRQDKGGEDLALRRVRRPRVPHVGAPLLLILDHREP